MSPGWCEGWLLTFLCLAGAANLTSCAEDPAGTTKHELTMAKQREWSLALHGGAGTISPDELTPDKEKAIHATLTAALESGADTLKGGGSSLDAVVAAIVVLEDSPLFNAGRGAVFNAAGDIELDASIMDGQALQAGAVAGVRRIKNPIRLARAVMDHSRHVMLFGAGAEQFATEQGVEVADPAYFYTEHRWEQWQKARQTDQITGGGWVGDEYYGTVGAVARDRDGNLAAGTSTGGLTNKRFGRVGDSPIIGAGTYASNESCAVSGTGEGEYFIRATIARDVCALVEPGGFDVQTAVAQIVHGRLEAMGGHGGVIAMDASGHVAMDFNTNGMYRGTIAAGSEPETWIYRTASAPQATPR